MVIAASLNYEAHIEKAFADRDTIDATIESVGTVSIDVAQRDISFADVVVEMDSQNRSVL